MAKTTGTVAVATLGAGRDIGGTCEDHRHFALDQVGRQFREAIKLTVRPAEFDRHVLAVDVAGFV